MLVQDNIDLPLSLDTINQNQIGKKVMVLKEKERKEKCILLKLQVKLMNNKIYNGIKVDYLHIKIFLKLLFL